MTWSDRELSRKLERAEGRANAAFVDARARLYPESGATWVEIAGICAMYDGAESPCTQTFGLGLFDEITDRDLDQIEAFFAEHAAPVLHEVSPMSGGELLTLLNERRYRPVELSNVLYRELGDGLKGTGGRGSQITTRVIAANEAELWARTSAGGWATEHEGLEDFMFGFGQVSAQCDGGHAFLAEMDGQAIATGMLFIHDDVALLGGASTLPDARNQGAQNALLFDRLRFAAEKGCTLASMAALPGSQSQINAQKNGFHIAYTRTKWALEE